MSIRTLQVADFVNGTFAVGDELQPWTPDDWNENPVFLQRIADPSLKEWAKVLNLLWKNLSRKIDEDVRENPELYSTIYVPNGFVVPGK